LRDIGGFLSSRNVEAFFGTFRSNLYRFRVDFGTRMKVIFEKTNYSFPKMKSHFHTHLTVVKMVMIVGEYV
jgi:hypothetical protein